MRIGLVEFLLILAIASLTIGPQVALFVDRWMRRANRANARAARRRAEYAAQMAVERDALLKRFRTASTVFGVCILLALVYALVFRPIDTPPQAYDAPAVRQDTGAAQTALAADHKGTLDLGEYQGVDCIRTQDGLVYAAAYDGAAKKRTSDLVRTDGGHDAAILSVDGELTGFAFDGSGGPWLSILTPGGGVARCRAAHDSWGTAVEQVVTQIDGAPLGLSQRWKPRRRQDLLGGCCQCQRAANGLESTLRTELLAHTGNGLRVCIRPGSTHGAEGAGRCGRCFRAGLEPGRQHAVRGRPWEPLRGALPPMPATRRRAVKPPELCFGLPGIPVRWRCTRTAPFCTSATGGRAAGWKKNADSTLRGVLPA